jgi:ankyrin repeat protein
MYQSNNHTGISIMVRPNDTFDNYINLLIKDPSRFISEAKRAQTVLQIRGLHGETLLHYLAVEGELSAVEALLKLGSDPNCENSIGTTPLIDAATLGNVPMVKLLLEHGAQPNRTNKDGSTPLHYAAEHGHRSVFDLLINHGGEKTVKNRFGETPASLLEAT